MLTLIISSFLVEIIIILLVYIEWFKSDKKNILVLRYAERKIKIKNEKIKELEFKLSKFNRIRDKKTGRYKKTK